MPASAYLYCIQVIVPEADREGANQAAAAASPDYDGAFADANVSAGGLYPPTHIFVSGRTTEAERVAFATELADWATHGMSSPPQYWLIRAEDGVLLGTNVLANVSQIGQPWGVGEQNAFAAAGMAWTQFPDL